ncbi:MAG TPA: efflux RND transporter permease subunit [Chthoniobacterales bacterium]|jgi:multidrug efflux pump
MKFTDLFIKRPVVAIVVNLVILLAGFQAIKLLNVRQYPKSDSAVVTVMTAYIGANADLVRGFITTPLERVISSADGIDYIESASSQGLSAITVHLKLNYDTNAALTQIQSKVNQVRNDLPPEAESPIINVETSDNRFASMYISFFSKDYDQNQITDYLTRVVQPKIAAIKGVQRADILGARTFAMRIWLKSDRMAALNITPVEVSRALQANNYLSAVGATKGSMVSMNLVANTNLNNKEEFQELVIRQQNGAIVRLKDIADINLGAEDSNTDVRFKGQTATFMGVWVLPTANSIDVIADVRKILPDIKAALPQGMNVDIGYDGTSYINDALEEVFKTLSETLVIVIIVIFLFLGSVRSVIIPIVAIPISLVGAVFIMFLFGFTINLLTILAIVLAVGLVVDDAIVVVENVERHLQAGMTAFNAAILSARELFGPIIAMTVTLAAVYAPIGIQGGLTGTLFREFAFTLAGAVLVSGVVALTLSPMMASVMLKEGDSHKGFAGWVNKRFDSVRRGYLRMLDSSLKYRPVTVMVWLLFSLLTIPLWMFSLNELAPTEDQGVVFGIVQAAPNSTIEQTTLYTEMANEMFLSFPETANTFQLTNPTGGFSGMLTKPFRERTKDTKQLAEEAFMAASQIPGIRMITIPPDPLPGGSDFPVDFVISSTAEPKELLDFANQLVAAAMQSGIYMFADTDLKYDQPQTEIIFDRDKVASLGLNLQQVGADLGTLLGGNFVNRFDIQGRSYKVIPQLKRGERLNADQLKDYYVSGPDGKLVQLSTFATIQTTTEPRQLNRFQQLNSARIQGALPPGVTPDMGLKILEEKAAQILPKNYVVDYAGSSRQLRKEANTFVYTLILAIILIFLVLAVQFNNFRDPVIILLGSVPLALTGALLFSHLGFTSINIYSKVGLITLVGLIAKNGILIVEFSNKLQEEGMDKLRAAIEASGTRLRPILMTSVATVVGHFPLIIAEGPGAAARNSIGYMLVSGMIIGTVFTLFVVPAIYVVLAKDHRKDNQRKAAVPPQPTAPEPVLV